MKNTVLTTAEALKKLGFKVSAQLAKTVTKIVNVENKFTLVYMTAVNPTSKRGKYEYIRIIDNEGVVLAGYDERGLANWNQRTLNGKLSNNHIVISNEYPIEKRGDVIKMIKNHFGKNITVRFQDCTVYSWSLNDVDATDC